MSEQARIWAHNTLASYLDRIGKEFPSFPSRTVIVRDPNQPEMHIVVTNEPDEIAEALTAIVHVPVQPNTDSYGGTDA